MADQDIQLDLKKRARRRLVGAAALALLAAVVLPLVMDKEPRPVGQDIQIRIPGQEPAAPVPAEKAASVPTEAVTAAVPEPASARAVAAPQTVPPLAAKADAGKEIPKEAPKETPRATEKPAAKVPEKLAEKPAGKPAEKAAAMDGMPAAEAARAEAILNGGEAPATGGYVIQLGVFSDVNNVRKLRQKVKAAGYNSFAEQVDTAGGQKTRVRAGPFASKDAAQKAKDKLKQAGLDGIVAGK